MKKLQIFEILEKLSEFTGEGSVTQKVEWLRQNDSATLRTILKHAFDPTVKYNLPDGDPPYKVNNGEVGVTESSLFAETRKLGYLWLVPGEHDPKAKVGPHARAEETTAEFTAAKERLTRAQEGFTKAQQELIAAQQELQAANVAFAESKERYASAKLSVQRLETLYVQFLESLHAKEATVALAAKNKTLGKLYDLNRKIVKEAFPDLLA